MSHTRSLDKMILKFVTLLAMLGLLLSACGSPATPEVTQPTGAESATEPPAPPASGAEEVVFWAALGGNNGTILENMVNDFNASQQEVVVKYEFQGTYAETEQKLMAGLAADTVPDLAMLEISRIPGFANSGALLALDDFAAGADGIDLTDFSEGLLSESKINGKLYSLPQARSMPVFYYNKAMFDAAGIPSDSAPANWEELRQAAMKLTKEDGSQVGFGIQIGNPWWYFQMAVENYGGEISQIVDGACTPTFNDATGVEALQWWVDLVNVDKAARI